MPLPTVPVSVWDQIAIVVIFCFLLVGLGWVLTRIFSGSIKEANAAHAQAVKEANAEHAQTIKDITVHYSDLVIKNNDQWQKYFDARADSTNIISQQMLSRLDEMSQVLSGLVNDFSVHDAMQREGFGQVEQHQSDTRPVRRSTDKAKR